MYVRFAFLTAITMKNDISWYVTQYSLVEIYRHFGVTFCLHRHIPWNWRQEVFSRKSVNYCQSTRCHTAGDTTS